MRKLFMSDRNMKVSVGSWTATESKKGLQVPPAWKTRTDLQKTEAGVKRGCKEVRGKESRKRKRGKSNEANGTDDLSSFKEM